MILVKTSQFTGNINEMELPNVTTDQYESWKSMTRSERPLVQDFFPGTTLDEREFIVTGCNPEEWDKLFDFD